MSSEFPGLCLTWPHPAQLTRAKDGAGSALTMASQIQHANPKTLQHPYSDQHPPLTTAVLLPCCLVAQALVCRDPGIADAPAQDAGRSHAAGASRHRVPRALVPASGRHRRRPAPHVHARVSRLRGTQRDGRGRRGHVHVARHGCCGGGGLPACGGGAWLGAGGGTAHTADGQPAARRPQSVAGVQGQQQRQLWARHLLQCGAHR